MASIAQRYGFLDWHVVWECPENEKLRSHRPNPHVLMPGDEVLIPDMIKKSFNVQTGRRHTFTVKQREVFLRLGFLHEGSTGLKADYVLKIDNLANTLSGSLVDGILEVEVPATARTGHLKLYTPDNHHLIKAIVLSLGELDPVTEPSGLQERLRRLGFDCGNEDEVLGPATRAALLRFQRAYGLVENGEDGPETQAKLLELVGT